jgi:6-phosphogluconolactonase
MPRNFAIDPTGAFLLAANQNTNNIVVFRIDQSTGRLTPTGDNITTPLPVSILFLRRQ